MRIHQWRRGRGGCDAGSTSLLLVSVGLVVVLACAKLAASGRALIDRARADSAAEAAALAMAVGADPGVAAERNGGRLIAARSGDPSGARGMPRWEVWVSVGSERSSAAATIAFEAYSNPGHGVPGVGATVARYPDGEGAVGAATAGRSAGWGSGVGSLAEASTLFPPGGGKRQGLAPDTLLALARADALLKARGLPSPVPVVSGLRSYGEQLALWLRRGSNPYPVARPGTSAHELGLAVDVPARWVSILDSVAREAGLCQPYPERDPIHFGPLSSPECGGSGARLRPRPVLVAPPE